MDICSAVITTVKMQKNSAIAGIQKATSRQMEFLRSNTFEIVMNDSHRRFLVLASTTNRQWRQQGIRFVSLSGVLPAVSKCCRQLIKEWNFLERSCISVDINRGPGQDTAGFEKLI